MVLRMAPKNSKPAIRKRFDTSRYTPRRNRKPMPNQPTSDALDRRAALIPPAILSLFDDAFARSCGLPLLP